MTAQLTQGLLDRLEWIGVAGAATPSRDSGGPEQQRDLRLLDYACGWGSLSEASPRFLNPEALHLVEMEHYRANCLQGSRTLCNLPPRY